MEKQLEMDMFSGEFLRDEGIQRALDHADFHETKWTETAYNFLLTFVKNHPQFMAEDIRVASVNIVPDPPSKRAWGGVIVRAVKAGIIKRKGFHNVKNPKAHCTPATLWETNSNYLSTPKYTDDW